MCSDEQSPPASFSFSSTSVLWGLEGHSFVNRIELGDPKYKDKEYFHQFVEILLEPFAVK